MEPVYFSPGTAVFSSTVLLSTAICARAVTGAVSARCGGERGETLAKERTWGRSYGVLIRVSVTIRV